MDFKWNDRTQAREATKNGRHFALRPARLPGEATVWRAWVWDGHAWLVLGAKGWMSASQKLPATDFDTWEAAATGLVQAEE